MVHRENMFPTEHAGAVASARCELGAPFQFSRVVDLSTRNTRLQSDAWLVERAHLVQTSVWPATFYGAEGHCHSCSELSALRCAAAYAIIGEHKTMSPMLALGAVTECVQDPQLYLIEQQLQQLRRSLWVDPDTALGVLEDNHKGRSRTAVGPASALRLALPRAGLKLDENGTLTAPDLVSLDLFTCHRHQLRRLL